MQNIQFRVHLRFNDFLKQLRTKEFLNFRYLFNALGWWISFFIVIDAFERGYMLKFLWLIVHLYFWFSFNKNLLEKVTSPPELLLALILFFAIIDFSMLNTTDIQNFSENLTVFYGGNILGIIHKFLLSLMVLPLGLLLIQTNKRRQKILLLYLLIGILGHLVFFYEQYIYLVLFQFFLFFLLLKRTTWLETLTRLELIIYFALLLWIFLTINEPKFFASLRTADETQHKITFSIPYFSYLIINLYWLALIIRIPLVVIYNHASLARKLKIAGLFQSSFPLFIQLLFLTLIFFLFISGWQANQLRDRLMATLNEYGADEVMSVEYDAGNPEVEIPNFIPFRFEITNPQTGVVELIPGSHFGEKAIATYYFYLKQVVGETIFIKLIKIDSTFLTRTSRELSILAGSGLAAYPQVPKRWMQYLDQLEFWQKNEVMRINPFALIFPFTKEFENTQGMIQARFTTANTFTGTWDISFFGYTFHNPLLIVGRVNIPLINRRPSEQSTFAFDVYFDLRSLWQWNFMTQILLGLILLFVLFNTLVIRRVIAFGSQINDSVIVKFDELKKGIREVSTGNLQYKIELEGEDEFVELANRFNQMGVRLQETLEEAREKDRLDQELKMARQVQLSLLSEKLPDIPAYHTAAHIQTATEIGGDFYDLIALDENRFLFAIGDVSGKGSSAAFYMAQFISLLRFSPRFTSDPQNIVLHLNEYIMNQISDRQIFITAIIGVLNSKTDEVEMVRAGHNLPILLSPSGRTALKEISSSGIGIGLTKSNELLKKTLKYYKFTMQREQKLILYTDGIVEARRPVSNNPQEQSHEVYGEERLTRLLIENKSKTAQDLVAQIIRDLNLFYADYPRIDDDTILIIEKD